MIAAGLIGYGYWGAKHARNVESTSDLRLTAIADVSRERLTVAAELHPNVALFDSGEALLNRECIEAVIIATPVIRHYSLCKLALEKGKHVLVEKPMTTSEREGIELVELAIARGLSFMVDHTYIYSSAIRRIHELMGAGALGSFVYFDSVRANLGTFRKDVNVIWDLAAHDFSIVDHLFPSRAVRVSASAARLSSHGQECIAYVTVSFEDGCEGHFTLNWLAPEKTRKIVICGSKKILAYDDLQPLNKLRIYENPCMKKDFADRILAQSGFVRRPVQTVALDSCEPIKKLLSEFANTIRTGSKTVSGGDAGVRVVRMIAAADRSARAGGVPVLI